MTVESEQFQMPPKQEGAGRLILVIIVSIGILAFALLTHKKHMPQPVLKVPPVHVDASPGVHIERLPDGTIQASLD